MKKNKFPKGWDEKRVKEVIAYYESQSDEESMAEDEAAYEQEGFSMIEIPTKMLPVIRDLLANYKSKGQRLTNVR